MCEWYVYECYVYELYVYEWYVYDWYVNAFHTDIEELQKVASQFKLKFGRKFVAFASNNSTRTVNPEVGQ